MFNPRTPDRYLQTEVASPTALADNAQSAARALLRNSSIELTTNGREAIEAASRVLPRGTRVYVPKMPRQTLEEKLIQITLLRELGLEPVPHIVARQLRSREQLRDFLLSAAREAGVRRVLVIGGDQQQEAGPFAASAEVIASGELQEAGVTAVDVAGYPDGHPQIPGAALRADLELKRELAAEQGLRLGIVTQFSFNPSGVADYCHDMARFAPELPILAGIPGPTSAGHLLRYAKICGVSTSIKAINHLGTKAVRLAMRSRPDHQLEVLARRQSLGGAGILSGVHLFSFGGFVESARWLDRTARKAGS